MDWSGIIVAVVGLIASGGIIGLFTLRQDKRSKEIDNEKKIISEYKELLKEYKDEATSAKKEVEQLREEINSMRIEMAVMNEKLVHYQLMLQQASAMKCDKFNCNKRRPPIDMEALQTLGDSVEIKIEEK